MTNKRMNGFLFKLFEAIIVRRGRFNFTNVSRYGDFHECTLRRRFGRAIDWLKLNLAMLDRFLLRCGKPIIGSMDCSFIRKSGTKTYGLDKFWSGAAKKALNGLELSIVSLIDVVGKEAWALDTTQTPAGLSTKESTGNYSRMDFYVEQLCDCLPHLPGVKHFAGDSAYANVKVIRALRVHGKHLVTQLRCDANLRYTRPLPNPGRPGPKPRWGEKAVFTELGRWRFLGRDFKYPHLDLYTCTLYSPHFNCLLKVVLVKNRTTCDYRLLASTDIHQDARQVVAYYQSRFQIEFLIRDAKQFAGLEEAQTRDCERLDFHFNASLTTVNLMQLLLKKIKPSLHSKNSIVRWAYNQKLIDQVIHELGMEPELVNSNHRIRSLYHYGLIHAGSC
jgi:hypothetical protein